MTEQPWEIRLPQFEKQFGREIQEFRQFMLEYRFGMGEIVTKLKILRDEFAHLHEYNPIENISSRLKTPASLAEKMGRKGCDSSLESIREQITDVAGVRVTCSFISDVYRVFDLLSSQLDLTVLEVRDYVASPKPNGYRSLHALVQVPVFLSGGAVPVVVELQIRTIAMDFWASLEHKIYYKYRQEIPQELLDGLAETAMTAQAMDATMERLHQEVRGLAPLADEVMTELREGDGVRPMSEFLESLRELGDDEWLEHPRAPLS